LAVFAVRCCLRQLTAVPAAGWRAAYRPRAGACRRRVYNRRRRRRRPPAVAPRLSCRLRAMRGSAGGPLSVLMPVLTLAAPWRMLALRKLLANGRLQKMLAPLAIFPGTTSQLAVHEQPRVSAAFVATAAAWRTPSFMHLEGWQGDTGWSVLNLRRRTPLLRDSNHRGASESHTSSRARPFARAGG